MPRRYRSRSSASYKGRKPSRGRSYNLRPRGSASTRKSHSQPKYKSVGKPAMKMVKRALSLDPRAFQSAWKTGSAIGHNIRVSRYKRGGRGYSGGSQLGGKFGDPWLKRKPQKFLGKWTSYGIQQQGITLRYENRKSVSGAESVAIGHTSLPGQICCINFWRALIKYLMVKIGCQIKDYGNTMSTEGFAVGDVVSFNFFGSAPESMTVSVVTQTVDATMTYDKLAALFASHFDGFDLIGERPESLQFIPAATSQYTAQNLQLNTVKVSVTAYSKLTVQNVTTEDAQDDEADDINAVPLVGKIIKTSGNNLLRKSNRKTLPGLFQVFSDDCLFEGYTKQTGAVIGGTPFYYYDNTAGAAQTTFFKPAETPRDFDIKNLLGTAPAALQPGEIKHCVLNTTFEMSLTRYWELLYTHRTHKQGTNQPWYNVELGQCQTLVLEKAVGRKPLADGVNDIKLWVQLQYHQSVLIHGKNSVYTNPIQMQTDFD